MGPRRRPWLFATVLAVALIVVSTAWWFHQESRSASDGRPSLTADQTAAATYIARGYNRSFGSAASSAWALVKPGTLAPHGPGRNQCVSGQLLYVVLLGNFPVFNGLTGQGVQPISRYIFISDPVTRKVCKIEADAASAPPPGATLLFRF